MSPLTTRQSAGLLAVLLFACFSAAAIGGLSTAEAVRAWYPTLDKPPWTPPSWAFGPIWTVLYTAMAFAAWQVVRTAPERARELLTLFGVQLLLNAAWSPVFFGMQQPELGLVVITAMWMAIVACIVRFWPISRAAAAAMGLYLAWVSVAWSLNAWIAWFNP